MQVVSNLLNNSAKYSDDGGRIELTLDAIGDQAVLRVRDTGIGIEPTMLPRIFDLFTQADGSASRANRGLGIGLALVRNLIDLHGGGVQAASAGLGHGTEVVVRLPLLRKMPGAFQTASESTVGLRRHPRDESWSSMTTGMRPTAWRRCSDLTATRYEPRMTARRAGRGPATIARSGYLRHQHARDGRL